MKDFERELKNRVAFLQRALEASHTKGFVFGNSGGKDSALVGILCKMACENTVGVMMPVSTRNFDEDMRHGRAVADQFGIETRTVPLKATADALAAAVEQVINISDMARANIAPRLRMATLYTIAASEGRLVVGTGNRSEAYMGYFTKWGDGAYDVNPIADLTVTELYAFLRYLGAPDAIISKAPSAALFDGQTDEDEMGVTYAAIDRYLETGEGDPADLAIIRRMHEGTHHKRRMPLVYSDSELL